MLKCANCDEESESKREGERESEWGRERMEKSKRHAMRKQTKITAGSNR